MFNRGLQFCSLVVCFLVICNIHFTGPLNGMQLQYVEGREDDDCNHHEVILDCRDDWNCSEHTKTVLATQVFQLCSIYGSCSFACTKPTGTYQFYGSWEELQGKSIEEIEGEKWNCGKKWAQDPSCAFFVSDQKCKCTITGTPSATDCMRPKILFSNCIGQ